MEEKNTVLNTVIEKAIKNKNWDTYRKYYSALSVEDHIEISVYLDKLAPNQAHFSIEPITELFTEAKNLLGELNIIELGCWTGDLAKEVLSKFDIKSWIGYDISANTLKRSVVKDERYKTVALSKWIYDTTIPDFNVFLSTHTFEHMSLEEVEKTVAYISDKTKYMILEIPLSEDGQDWKGYSGTHVLTASRQTIRDLITSHGFVKTKDTQIKSTSAWTINTGTFNWITGWKKEI